MARRGFRIGTGRTRWRSGLPVVMLMMSACAGIDSPPGDASADHRTDFAKSETFVSHASPLPQWSELMAREANSFGAADPIPAEWRKLLAELHGMTLAQKVQRVNAEVNKLPYVASDRNWGRPDYWETPVEFLAKHGQCQDYAATKYFLLRASGIPASDLQVVVVQDSQTAAAHAVLIADPQGAALLLDNQSKEVVSFSAAARYTALYALNEDGWWTFKSRRSDVTRRGRYVQAKY